MTVLNRRFSDLGKQQIKNALLKHPNNLIFLRVNQKIPRHVRSSRKLQMKFDSC